MSMDEGLPKGWVRASIGEVVELMRNGITVEQNKERKGVPISRIETISNSTIDYERVRHVENPSPVLLKEYLLRPGDLLFSHINSASHLGKTALFEDDARPLLHGMNLLLLRPGAQIVSSRFLHYLCSYFRATGVFSAIAQHAVNQASINQAKLSAVRLNLPPRNEQRRIVAKIEELFSDLDAGVAALERAKAKLKRYRAAVLKAAVEGKLTEEWRKKNRPKETGQQLLARILVERRKKWEADQLATFKKAGKKPPPNWQQKYKEPSAPDTTDLPDLPEGWVWASVEQVTENYDGRRIPIKSEDRDRRSGPYPYYGASGIIDDIDGFLFDGEFLLIAEDGANLLSRSTPIAFQAKGQFWVNNHAHIVQLHGGMPLGYLETFFNATRFDFSITGTAQPKLTQAAMNKIRFPLPPLPEQEEIVSEVESRLSITNESEAQLATNHLRSTRLRQSILKRAFEGKLVPQDPRDEPASVLLERIDSTTKADRINSRQSTAVKQTNTKHQPTRKTRH